MEKCVDVHTLIKVDIIKGFLSNIDNTKLCEIAIKHFDEKLSPHVEDTRYEDTFLPECNETEVIVSQLKDVFEHVYPWATLDLSDQWAHIHKTNMSTNTHSHNVDGISAVYYAKVDNKSGKICFEYRPYLESDLVDKCFDPMENMFLIFPGYLLHRVTRNLSTEDRVSISFNFNIKNKN